MAIPSNASQENKAICYCGSNSWVSQSSEIRFCHRVLDFAMALSVRKYLLVDHAPVLAHVLCSTRLNSAQSEDRTLKCLVRIINRTAQASRRWVLGRTSGWWQSSGMGYHDHRVCRVHCSSYASLEMSSQYMCSLLPVPDMLPRIDIAL